VLEKFEEFYRSGKIAPLGRNKGIFVAGRFVGGASRPCLGQCCELAAFSHVIGIAIGHGTILIRSRPFKLPMFPAHVCSAGSMSSDRFPLRHLKTFREQLGQK
jgi:hypothetical protein